MRLRGHHCFRLHGRSVVHVTGNFVLLVATIAGASGTMAHSNTAALQINTFPVFLTAEFPASLLHDRWPGRDGIRLVWIVAILTLAAATWSVTGITEDVGASLSLICAMATLNAAQRPAPEIRPPTTVMTGNTTQLAVSLAGAGDRSIARQKRLIRARRSFS
ncbi:DUF1275 family protein [Jannaschia rubra]|nr:DUF1275 family protein [Jannaschia rubra]